LPLLDVLYHTQLNIRGAHSLAFAHALADAAHNIPSLITRYHPDRLWYYWNIERLWLIVRGKKEGWLLHGIDEAWTSLRPAYLREMARPERAYDDPAELSEDDLSKKRE
jgi:hypothetical protein